MTNKGMAISTEKFGTLIGFNPCRDGEAKYINREQVSD
jgi:hypothetical protein